jgi:hypothetical protein
MGNFYPPSLSVFMLLSGKRRKDITIRKPLSFASLRYRGQLWEGKAFLIFGSGK